jgi:hypothetical protein
VASAVEALYEQARDDDETVTDILTRAVYLSTVLRHKPITDWLKHELRGYEPDETLPVYRCDVPGLLLAWMPGKDWIEAPILESVHQDVARTRIHDGVHELEQTYARTRRHGNYRIDLPQAQQEAIKARTKLDTRLNLALPSRELARILQTLRITVELWTADLMEADLKTDGMTFTAAEREAVMPLAGRLDDYLARATEQAPARAEVMSSGPGTGRSFLRRLFGQL